MESMTVQVKGTRTWPEAKVCPTCGRPVDSNWGYCPHCGRELG